jgi:4-amino-4-deoxy-L-arabinose transferase-like glycosyltransferase
LKLLRSSPRALLAGLIVLGVFFRLWAVLSFPVYPLIHNTADTAIYDEGARSLASSQGYRWGDRPTAFFPVGWPLLLSQAYRFFGYSPRAGQLLNFGLSLLLWWGAWGLARRLHGARTARIVAAFMAFSPHHLVYPAFLMSEVAFTAFFLSSLWVLAPARNAAPELRGAERPPDRAAGRGARGEEPVAGGSLILIRLIAAGFLMGAATLVRGVALVYPLVVLVSAWLGEGRSWKRSLGMALVFSLAMLVPLAPWTVRNYRVFSRFVLVANDGGMNFLMGNHEGATGARHEPAGGLPDTGDEVADDREAYRRGFEFIRTKPLKFLLLLPKKLIRLTAPAPSLTYRRELLAKWPKAPAWGLLLVDAVFHLALWGLLTLRTRNLLSLAGRAFSVRGSPEHRDPGWVFSIAVLGLWIAVHLVFLGGARYFFPMTPILMGLAFRSGGLRKGLGRHADGDREK